MTTQHTSECTSVCVLEREREISCVVHTLHNSSLPPELSIYSSTMPSFIITEIPCTMLSMQRRHLL